MSDTSKRYKSGEGYNNIFVLSRPDIIGDIHAAFFDVGCDVHVGAGGASFGGEVLCSLTTKQAASS